MFKINEYLVYKNDVCKVKEYKKNLGNDYYVLIPLNDESLKIEVPISDPSSNLRKLMSKKEVEELINRIPSIEIVETNERLMENEYRKLLNSKNHEDLIKIIKTTYLRNKERLDNNKKIGDKDNDYFKKAEKYLYTEFSIVLNKDYEETKKYVVDKVGNITK